MMAGTFPKSGTQAARLLSVLLTGLAIGPLNGWRHIGIYRLADVVLQLRKAGWAVQTARVERDNRFGEQCSFASYSLPAEMIEAAGEDGQIFARHEAEMMASTVRRVAA